MSTPFYDLASLVVVPSGYKASKVYAQKPLTTDGQLSFSRASTATRVNSAGLIETVSSNVPRLDYTNSSCPKLLLEPSRTNAVLHSSDFTNGAYTVGSNAAVTSNTATSPSGYQDADTLANSGSSSVFLFQYVTSLTAQTVTTSVFAKKNTNKYLGISLTGDNSASSRYQAIFNLETGAFAQAKNSTTPLTGQSYKIENYGNGWYRCSVTATFAISAKPYVVLQNSNILSTSFDPDTLDWSDATTGSVYIWGMQAEGASYSTSIIPTTTAAVTRLADACSKTGISSLIGQTEGTLFVEMNINKRVYLGGTGPNGLEIKDASGNNVIMIGTAYDTNQIFSVSRRNSGSFSTLLSTTNNALGTYKLAAAYSSAGFVFYVNGVQIGTTATLPPSATYADMGLMQVFGTNNSQGELVNQALLFKTRLTNAQLAELTAL